MSEKQLAVEAVTRALVETCLEKSKIMEQAVKAEEQVAHLERLREEHQQKIKELSQRKTSQTAERDDLLIRYNDAQKRYLDGVDASNRIVQRITEVIDAPTDGYKDVEAAVSHLIKRYEANRGNENAKG